ncbi:MAG TPA: LacI family DNA-binding transcriptional regulator, partial [Armatimonadota bacterium]
MASIRSIAQLAGVSAMTVSRVLRGVPTVAPAIRDRVLQVADIVHYYPNRLAQGLITGSNATIACILPYIRSAFFTQIMQGVLEAAMRSSYHVLTYQT